MKISILFLIFCIWNLSIQAQKDDAFFQNIKDACWNLETPIIIAKFDNLKNVTPPKNTWEYSSLLAYKEQLETNKDAIIYGFFIEPTIEEGVYGYNSFAFKKIDDNTFKYFFALIVSVNTNNDKYIIEKSYLFTAESSLKSWWSHALWFYEKDKIKEVPKEFLFHTCPPPPFKI